MTEPETPGEPPPDPYSNDDDHPPGPREPSTFAREVERLKAASLKAARERERLPQPLFWSLFHSKLKDLKREKELKRLLDDLLG